VAARAQPRRADALRDRRDAANALLSRPARPDDRSRRPRVVRGRGARREHGRPRKEHPVRIAWISVVALVAVAALAGVVAITAMSAENGARRGNILYRHAGARAAPVRELQLDDCAPGGGTGRSALRVGGACRGLLTGNFDCVADDELAAFSIRRPIGGGRDL